MAEDKTIGFSIDFGDTKNQLDKILKGLNNVKGGFEKTGKNGKASLDKLSLGLKSVFQNVSKMSSSLRQSLAEGSKLSKKQLNDILIQSRKLEQRLGNIHAKTAKKFENAEGAKKKALRSTISAQKKAIRDVQKLSTETQKSTKEMTKAFQVLSSIVTIKLASAFRSVAKEATILAARNQVLGTAMRTVANNAGITNAEIDRSETKIKKLGISINDTRELISRFAQAQLGLGNATKLASAAQDLAAGSTLGSSEALRIMTQSILSLLPRQLRQFGVVVNLNQVYKEQSRILGKSVDDLTTLEKRQGLLNKIFEEAAKRAGAYDRSMEDAGKVMTTLSSRIIPDTLSMFGDQLLPVFSAIVFAVKDTLTALQGLSPTFKTLVSAIGLGITVILSLKAALVLLGGTLGFVKAGFAGAAAGAATTGAAFGPLIIGLGALAAALVIIPKLFEDSATAQEQMLEASKALLGVQSDRLKQVKDLISVVSNSTATEEDLRKIVENSIKRHKELVPLLSQEVITREDILEILESELDKREELVDKTLASTKELSQEQIKALEAEKDSIGDLIVTLTQLQAKFGEGEVPILSLTSALGIFQQKAEESGQDISTLGKHMREFADENDEGLNKLKRAYKDLGSEIRNASKEIETDFGLAAKGVTKNAGEMEQAFLGLNERLDKLASKTQKKFPFEALIKEQEAFVEALDKAVLDDSRRNELQLKAQTVFQSRFSQAEAKFREKLASIGATDLEKIDAKLRRELELNRGSELAIRTLETKAAADRNNIFTKMWDDRLSLTQDGVKSIGDVIKTERDLAIQQAQRETSLIIASEITTADQRIAARSNFHDRSLRILETSQVQEFNVRKQHFNAVATQLTTLFNSNIINEQQFNERSKALATELKDFRKTQITERVDFLKSALSQMLAAEVTISERLKTLEAEKQNASRSTEDALRQIRQQGQSEGENFQEERLRAEKLLSEGEVAIREGNFERVKEINNEVKSIALATSKEVKESSAKDAAVLVSADQARIGSLQLVKSAGALLQKAFVEQRKAEVDALSTVKDKIDEIKTSLDLLLSEQKQIEIEVIGEAEKQIDIIQKKLDGLKDKTITVTVVTKQVSVKGGTSKGTTKGGAEAAAGGPAPSTPALANGAVNIGGPGSSKSDSILASISRGESIITAAATQAFGPLLELMNTNPDSLRRALSSGVSAPGIANQGGSSVTNSTDVGRVVVNINGVESKDIKNIDWRLVTRNQIIPEIEKVNKRRPSI